MNDKPFKGAIKDWYKKFYGSKLVIEGTYVDHYEFRGQVGHTSMVVSLNEETGEFETLNSRYKLVGEPKSTSPMDEQYNDFLAQCKDLESVGYKVYPF